MSGGDELRDEVHGLQVGVHHVVPVRLAEGAERRVVERPGIVHDDARRAQARPHQGDEAPHVVRARDVRREHLGHAALAVEVLRVELVDQLLARRGQLLVVGRAVGDPPCPKTPAT
jgi:hypothetical protein